jgi:non-specific serine/threonine protein kinase/serine/threonine-protein kinase
LGDGACVVASADEPDCNVVTDERWDRIKQLLYEAMQLTPERRAEFLEEACPSGDPCRSEIESLLAANADARSNFLLSGSTGGLALGIGAETGLSPGTVFEQRFQLIEVLGEGGMGQVWLAEQISPVRRQVALKLIKAGMYDDLVVQRFQYERQSLAIMDHPAIAKVFEAGATPQGQPYFVMEYVPGLPITDYCDRHRLGIAARLEIFTQACEGVQHAHQRAIIHRDLKPANILVVEIDGKPVPRIIDFGLAKAAAPRLLGTSEYTLLGQFVGTPGYMSPEQADPDVQDIDIRTDVYSLGVVLYVLLTGYLPFDEKSGKRLPLDVRLKQLREEDPPRPSTKVYMDRDASVAAAAARGTEPAQLAQQLRGDLDWITIKALERDRTRRYGTPLELAADVRRYSGNEPVIARPASPSYRLRKYLRRHRVAVGIVAGFAVLLTTFSVLQGLELRRTTLERDRANQERDRASRERDRATRITDFMTNMFKVSDPSEARGNSVTAREILDKASTDMTTGLAGDAEVQSQMLYVMANTYLGLGLYDRAHDLAAQALDARERLHGTKDRGTLESMIQLGRILDRQGHFAEAASLERRALEDEQGVLGPEAPATLETMDVLALIDQDEGHYQDAEKLARQVIASAARTLGPESSLTLRATNHLAGALWYEARYVEAENQYRNLMEVDRRVLGPDHPQTLSAMTSLALTLASEQRVTDAEQLYQQVLTAQVHVLGPEHQYTILTMENLAVMLVNEGRFAEAEKLQRQVLALRIRTLGAEHRETLDTKVNLADVLLKEGHVQEADKLQRETLALQQRVLGPQDPATLYSQSNLAAILIREHRYAEAAKIAADTWEARVHTLGPGHPDTLETLRNLGEALAYSHRYPEASRLFRDTIEQLAKGSEQENGWSVWYAFACVAVAGARSDDALRYLREAVNRGYRDADGLMAEQELKGLQHNAQFLELVRSLRSASNAAGKG